MAELVRWRLDNGGDVLVETRTEGPETTPVSQNGSLIESASATLDAALGHVRDGASAVLGQLRDMPSQPDRVEVEFGVMLSAQAGAVIAKTTADGHLNVNLTWQHKEADEAS